jgi:choline dehydrogenase-like flavoprotein
MGSDEHAVVDPHLRVRGIDGLRIADASVMPMIIRGHTHAPAVMIAERAADFVRGRVTAEPGKVERAKPRKLSDETRAAPPAAAP